MESTSTTFPKPQMNPAMTRSRVVFLVLVGAACGDEPTEPPPPPLVPTTITVTSDTGLVFNALAITVRLTATVRDQNGATMSGVPVAWASNDTSVATVTPAGLLTSVGNGTATISASAGSASANAMVTVAQEVVAVAVVPATGTVVAGDTLRLASEATDANGHIVAAAGVSWASSDTVVAMVDSSGLVTGVDAGNVEITATSSEVVGRATLTVLAPAPAAVLVEPDTVRFSALGDTTRLAVDVRDQIGRPLTDVTVSWRSADTTVASVDSTGLVTAAGDGATTVSATVGEVSGEAVVTVTQAVGSVVVSPAADTVAVGDTLRLVAKAFDKNGHAVAGVKFNWSSSNDSIARVDRSGLVTANSEGRSRSRGSVTITAASGDAQGTSEITVDSPDRGALVALYHSTDGPNWSNRGNWLTDAPLEDWYGVRTRSGRVVRIHLPENGLEGTIPTELGSLVNLEWLSLSVNLLHGPIPVELGDLVNLERLYLSHNHLRDPIPESFLQLDLVSFYMEQRSPGLSSFAVQMPLCVPGISVFSEWVQGIENKAVDFCNDADRETLESLFEQTAGSGWTTSGGWLTGPVLDEWHGIGADSLGRVTALDLERNELSGRLPLRLGGLTQMTELRIGGNASLSGPLPSSLTTLGLRILHYGDTRLCAPSHAAFREWLEAIPSHVGTEATCDLSDREILEAVYEVLRGSEWTNSENWLTNRPLGDWHGVTTDGEGRVIGLDLTNNRISGWIPHEIGGLKALETLRLGHSSRLVGTIPAELGDLANLQLLSLNASNLEGTIPVELGALTNLRNLRMSRSRLEGPIPTELGRLHHLEFLNLTQNRLSGAIPAELGGLAKLTQLHLGNNELTGPIPAGFGDLSRLTVLVLARNELSGSLPAGLGDVASLEELHVGYNGLHGMVSSEFQRLKSLREFSLQGNADMTGALPVGLAALNLLEELVATDTGLCAPADAGFLRWLDSLRSGRVARCEAVPAMAAYLVQTVQSREFPVPLVAGDEGMLRTFVTASRANQEPRPSVRALFHVNGTLVHTAEIPASEGPIPTEVEEGSLSASANALIPGEVIRPGLGMVIEIDSDMLDPELGVARRIPETGSLPVDVREMPVLDLTLIPFLWMTDPDSAILELTAGMAADPDGHELLAATRTLLPVGDLDVTAHDPVLTSSNDMYDVFRETNAMRALEAGSGHWVGMMSGQVTGAYGLAYTPGRVITAVPRSSTIAHELGHNMYLSHAPCGGSGSADPAFPYRDGRSGVWGYDHTLLLPILDPGFDGGRLVPPSIPDLMSGCAHPKWVSDYHFTKALRFRLADEGSSSSPTAVAESTSALMLWGGADSTGVPFLEPAFAVEAPPLVPDAAGNYRITGTAAGGETLFSISFTMPDLADGSGASSFVFVVPAQEVWQETLTAITLAGPGGSAVLNGESNRPMAIVRDPHTGQVRGFLRHLTGHAADAVGGVAGPRLDMLYSTGLPDAAAWTRARR